MKLPNGYGSIYRNGGHRRKPYAVVVTIGWDYDTQKQKRKLLSYVKTPKEGLKLLNDYHGNPYDLNFKNITFSDIWSDVEKQIKQLVDDGEMSQSNLDGLYFAYKNHCIPLHTRKIIEIKYREMQDLIDNAKNMHSGEPIGVTAKGLIKSVCVKVFNCAIQDYELPISNNPAINLKCGKKVKSDKHIPFTNEEIAIFWGLQYDDIVKIILILCYTGCRPNEIFTCEKNNIFIEDNYFISGSKTEAGKDRVIPIHPKIKHLMEYFYKVDNDYPFATIIKDFNYGKYKRRFAKLMKELNFEHTPYDGRHTFITKMKDAGANEYLLKLIVGHRIEDVTEKYYTHRKIEKIVEEVKKIT